MKQWITPDIDELNFKDTAWGEDGGWGATQGGWGSDGGWGSNGGWQQNNTTPVVTPAPGQEDLWKCSGPYWEGKGSDELSS